MLERLQADLVGLVGEALDLDEEILELRRKVSVVRSRRIWMPVVVNPPTCCTRKVKRGLREGEKSRS